MGTIIPFPRQRIRIVGSGYNRFTDFDWATLPESLARSQVTELQIGAVETAMLVEDHIPGYAFRPYVIGGMGLYHISDDGNHPGINVGMGIGLLPVTGIPLPFISHGGASLISLAIGLGVIQSVNIRQHRAEW